MNLFSAPGARSIAASSLAAALAVSACGYPKFTFDPAGIGGASAGGGGAGGSPAMDTATGTGGEPATSSASSSATASGTGGEPPCPIVNASKKGTCEYVPNYLCGCAGPKEKCAPVDPATGASDCVPMSVMAKPAWSACQTDADCAKKTWCDHVNHVCEPFCLTVDDCDPNQQCIPVLQDGMMMPPVPGLLVCTAHCDPLKPNLPCEDGLSCRYDFGVHDFECVRSKGVPQNGVCAAQSDCGPGLICVDTGADFTCQLWCFPADDAKHPPCSGIRPYCGHLNPTVMRDGVEYGDCTN